MGLPSLIPIQSKGSKPPFFCVAAPNVNALGYVALARHLSPDQPVFALQSNSQKLVGGEYDRQMVEILAAEYINAMFEVQQEGPYQLGGMCGGAQVAFEIARQLDARGKQISLLAILDTWVMENTYSNFWYCDYYVRRLCSLLRCNSIERWSFVRTKAKSLIHMLSNALFRRNKSPRDGHGDNPLKGIYFPGKGYALTIYQGRITLFRVHKQPYTRIHDYRLGWGKRTIGGVDVHLIPGSHETILREPHVQVLAKTLSGCLLRSNN